ncbi:hypothetical protein DFJ73DRAFT_757739 [Zopfochytrium polystomum]|nr:hypothetical protein DFJ73DRAFT_757739 [Zopfochytrium polystomum]
MTPSRDAAVVFFDAVPVFIKAPLAQSGSSPVPLPGASPSSASTVAASHSSTPLFGSLSPRRPCAWRFHPLGKHPQHRPRRCGRWTFRLTDDSDPFFLHQLNIAEEDFHSLRTGAKSLGRLSAVSAQMTLGLGQQPALLSIVETNSFKHIIHLSLQQYLASIVKELKVQNEALETQLQSTSDTLTLKLKESSASTSSLSSELEKLRLANVEQTARLQLSLNQKLAEEKEKYQRERDELRQRLENEKHDLQRSYEDQLRHLAQQSASLQSSQTQIAVRAQSTEANLAEEKRRNDDLMQKLQSIQRELDGLRAMNRDLSQERDALQRDLNDSRESAAALEGIIRESEEQRGSLEETVEAFRTQNVKLDENFRKATDEIAKGNEIIRRMQTELKTAKSKVKLKNVVTLQQEKLLDERASLIETLQKDLSSAKESLSKKEEEADQLKSRVDELTQRVDEGKKIIEDNTHVIEWLHRQLNEESGPRPFGQTASSALPTFARYDPDRYGSTAASAFSAPKSNLVGGIGPTGPSFRGGVDVGRYPSRPNTGLGGSPTRSVSHHSPPRLATASTFMHANGNAATASGLGRSGNVGYSEMFGSLGGGAPAGSSGGVGLSYYPSTTTVGTGVSQTVGQSVARAVGGGAMGTTGAASKGTRPLSGEPASAARSNYF